MNMNSWVAIYCWIRLPLHIQSFSTGRISSARSGMSFESDWAISRASCRTHHFINTKFIICLQNSSVLRTCNASIFITTSCKHKPSLIRASFAIKLGVGWIYFVFNTMNLRQCLCSLLNNVDFLLNNVDFLLNNVGFMMKI